MKRRKARPKKARPKSRRKPGPDDAILLNQLSLLRQRRLPYLAPLKAVVARTLAAFAPDEGRRLLEIGAGTGQLRELLPSRVAAQILYTDPSTRALRFIARAEPGAQTLVARAESLPLSDGECGAVFGLCVFDALADPARAVAELARVLHPGGRFVHFLDMATLLHRPFAQLAGSGLVPLPNVLSDPSDSEWPLDIVLAKRDELRGAQTLLARASAPPFAAFESYFRLFGASVFDARRAAEVFNRLASQSEPRQALRAILKQSASLRAARGVPVLSLLPFHSGKYLHSVMTEAFSKADLFEIEQDVVVAHACFLERSDSAHRYQSLCLGHQRLSENLPRRLLDPAAREQIAHHGFPSGQRLVEAGVFVFVARRV